MGAADRPRFTTSALRRLPLVACLLFVVILHAAPLTVAVLSAQESDPANPRRMVTGQVLSARDKKPLRNVPVRLGTETAATDRRGAYRFENPPVGEQLVAVDAAWLASKRQTLSDGTVTGAWHADPALVDIAEHGLTQVTAPIFVIEPSKKSHRLTPGKAQSIQPAHIPDLIVTLPEGTTIVGPDGQPQTELTVTPLSPDRVPPLPPQAAPRSVYLFSSRGLEAGPLPSRCRLSIRTISALRPAHGSTSGTTTRRTTQSGIPISGRNMAKARWVRMARPSCRTLG